jgi:hypothetical protein
MRGFGGLSTYFSTYLMSVGMPFELWMRRIAELAETEPEAGRFLELALEEIAALPWIRGGHWQTPDGEGRFGCQSEHTSRFEYHDLAIVFHTNISLSPALFLHMRLLSQVVGEFYVGKRRENALRQHAYLQAVHETGARLTHDMKNLMQALYALTSMAPREPTGGYTGLLQRQLPQLTVGAVPEEESGTPPGGDAKAARRGEDQDRREEPTQQHPPRPRPHGPRILGIGGAHA